MDSSEIISRLNFRNPFTSDEEILSEMIDRISLSMGRQDKANILLEIIHKEMQRLKIEPPDGFFSPMPGYIYIMKMAGYYKIGYSINPQSRSEEIGVLAPEKPEIIWTCHVPNMKAIESNTHKTFESNRVRGEWFRFTDQEIEDVKEYVTSASCGYYSSIDETDWYKENCPKSLWPSWMGRQLNG